MVELAAGPVDGPTTALASSTASITARVRSNDVPVLVELVDRTGRVYGPTSPGTTSGTTGGITWLTVAQPIAGEWRTRVSRAGSGAPSAAARSIAGEASAATSSASLVDVELTTATVEDAPVARGVVTSEGGLWRFDASTSTSSDALSQQWVFPDGTVADGEVVTRSFAEGVEPAAILTVTSASGASATTDVNRSGPMLPLLRPQGVPGIDGPPTVTVATVLRAAARVHAHGHHHVLPVAPRRAAPSGRHRKHVRRHGGRRRSRAVGERQRERGRTPDDHAGERSGEAERPDHADPPTPTDPYDTTTTTTTTPTTTPTATADPDTHAHHVGHATAPRGARKGEGHGPREAGPPTPRHPGTAGHPGDVLRHRDREGHGHGLLRHPHAAPRPGGDLGDPRAPTRADPGDRQYSGSRAVARATARVTIRAD